MSNLCSNLLIFGIMVLLVLLFTNVSQTSEHFTQTRATICRCGPNCECPIYFRDFQLLVPSSDLSKSSFYPNVVENTGDFTVSVILDIKRGHAAGGHAAGGHAAPHNPPAKRGHADASQPPFGPPATVSTGLTPVVWFTDIKSQTANPVNRKLCLWTDSGKLLVSTAYPDIETMDVCDTAKPVLTQGINHILIIARDRHLELYHNGRHVQTCISQRPVTIGRHVYVGPVEDNQSAEQGLIGTASVAYFADDLQADLVSSFSQYAVERYQHYQQNRSIFDMIDGQFTKNMEPVSAPPLDVIPTRHQPEPKPKTKPKSPPKPAPKTKPTPKPTSTPKPCQDAARPARQQAKPAKRNNIGTSVFSRMMGDIKAMAKRRKQGR